MKIAFSSDVNTGSFTYQAGQDYDVDPAMAARFIAQGVAYLWPGDASPVSGASIVGASKMRRMLGNVGQAAYRRVDLQLLSTSNGLGVDATNLGGPWNAAAFTAWNTQSWAAIAAKTLSGAFGVSAGSSSIMPGGTGGVINPLLTLGTAGEAGAFATQDGALGPAGWRLVINGSAQTVSFVAVGTQVRVYCAASGAGSTVALRYQVNAGAVTDSTLPAAAPNPGNTPSGTRTWNTFTISCAAGDTIKLIGPVSGDYSVFFIDTDYKPSTAGVTIHRLCQSGASLAELAASCLDNTDTTARFQAAWVGAGQSNVRLTQAQSLAVRVPCDGFILGTCENDLNDFAAYGYSLADLGRHLTNELAYRNSLGQQGLVFVGPIRDLTFSVGSRPYSQADIIETYRSVVAAAPNAGFLDLTAEFGGATTAGYAAQVAAGLMQDVVHWGRTGHGYVGARVAQLLLAAARA